MFVMAPLVLLINGFTKGDWTEALLFALSIAVGLTPEMLPMIVTLDPGQGRGVAVAQEKSSSNASTRSRTSAPWTCCAPTRPAR